MDETKLNAAQQPTESIVTASHASTVTLFPVVGIGASAGGLRALQRFLAHTPADSGLAFVIVTHLSPEYESHLPALLQPSTSMPVIQVAEETALSPNHVYMIPPGRNLQSIDSHLHLTPLEPERRQRAPIDHFLRTLADSHDSLAIAVILTGTGSDGALGLRRIKEVGGLTVVQDPVEAEYDSMPQAALATGDVELVLPVAEIATRLAEYVQNKPQVSVPQDGEPLPEAVGDLVQKILTQVRAYTGQDFLRYKSATILRRIRRRMQIQGFVTLSEYLKYLRNHATEVQALYQDFLITVTNFFRDPEAFAYLEREVIPRIFQSKNGREGVRVWTVGCATGEEAYSIAILLLEYASGLEHPIDIQIFASDLSEEGLRQGREGFYPETIAADITPERLERFFTKEQNGYRIRQAVRERVLFTPHSLLKDPPFSKLDLICCRNLLIYIQRDAQQEIMQLFHYALRPEGYLFLGTAETVEGSELFREVNRKYSLYQGQPVASQHLPLPKLPLTVSRYRVPMSSTLGDLRRPGPRYGELHGRVLERYAPPSLLVNADQNIVYFAAGVERYLQQPDGEPTNQILHRIRSELRSELMAALYRAQEKETASQSAPIPVTLAGQQRQVSLVVQPQPDLELTGFALVFFLESAVAEAAAVASSGRPQSTLVRNLEAELAETQKRLQINQEEYETSQEEMRAVNEELQSMNEELRSAAEELETSKEELQSVNEELMTVNQENKNKIEELKQLAGDLQNLLSSTEIATLFLDRELRIKRFTPRISELFNVLGTDRGRPLAHITHKLGAADLIADAQQVLRTLVPVEREISSNGGEWYIMRLLPYRTPDDRIDGVVITFVDITTNKANELALHNAKEYAESIVHTIPDALLVLEPDLRVQMANDAFYEIFQVNPAVTEGSQLYELGNGQWDIPALRTLLEEILPKNKVVTGYEVEHTFEQIGRRTMLVNGRRLDHAQLILLAIADISERKRAEEAVRASEEQLSTFVNATSDIVYEMSAEWSTMYSLSGKTFIATTENPRVDWMEEYVPAEERSRIWTTIHQAIATRSNFELEHRVIRLDGTIGWTFSRAIPLIDQQGKVVKWFGSASDITARKRTEEALRQSEEKYRTLFESIDEGFCLLEVLFDEQAHPFDYRFLDVNAAFVQQSGLTNAVGKTILELVPGLEPQWAEIYGRIAKTGVAERFEAEVKALGRVFDIYGFRTGASGANHVGVVFSDITERKRREANLAFLAEIMVNFAPSARADELMELVGQKLAQHLALARCDFSVVDVEADRITTIYDWRRDADAPSVLGEHAISTFLTPAAQQQYKAGNLAVINDVRNHPLINASAEMMDALRIGAVIDAPYLENGHWKFLLSVIHSEAHLWRPDEIELIRELAAHIYIRLERTRAEQAVQQSEAQLAAELAGAQQLQQVSSQLIQEDDIAALHQHLIAAATAIMQADMSSLQTLDPISNKLRLLAWTGFAPDAIAFGDQVGADSRNSCGIALARGQRVLLPDVDSEALLADTAELTAYQRAGVKAVQSTPLVARSGQIVGMISTYWRTIHEPAERELRLLDVLAREAADLIEQRNGMRALHQSEEHLRLLIESATDYAIFTTDLERRIVSWSKGAEVIFGYTADEVIGQSADIIFTAEDRAAGAPDDEAATALATGRAADERWHIRKDGSRFYASGVFTPLRDSELHGFVKIARDLTDVQQAAAERERLLAELAQERAELQKLNATLEKRVEERTAILAAKNRELDRFAHLAAHDLKEPLRGIQRLAEWIEEDAGAQLPAATQTHLAKLQQRVRRITQLVDDLLAYSRVGRISYSLEMVDPAVLIHNVVELLDLPPSCTITVHEPMPRLATARVPLETVFLNLIHNALKHHHQPAACQVEITAREQGQLIEFAVSDNGPGIESAQQARIFELFQTLRPRDEIEGSGMGLPIVQRILESYGGSIQVEANPAGGATFRFTWPQAM